MKKIFVFLISIFSILGLFSLNVNAETIEYKNIITDESTIEEDFNVLKMDIDNYYRSSKLNNSKWYVVAMGESYISDTQVQTYFYIYNCKSMYGVEFIDIDYSINYVKSSFNPDGVLSSIASKGLYKIKGFVYNFTSSDLIKITKINGDIYTADGLDSKINDVDFESTNIHSKANENLIMESNFKSLLVIDELELVRVNVQPDLFESCSFASWWNSFWDLSHKELYMHFYNFNFPDNIKVDSISYAKFEYDYVYYYHHVSANMVNIVDKTIEKERIPKFKEYEPKTNEFETFNQNGNLEFQTFTIGNRISLGEFPDYVDFTNEEKELFNYDCSILLDSSVKKTIYDDYGFQSYYYQLEYVDFLELHYENDGVKYECQVVSDKIGTPENPEISVDGEVPDESKKNMWELFVEWFIDNFPMSIAYIGLLLVLIIVGISLLPMMIPYIPKILITLFKVIKWLILLPFKAIKFIFNLFKRFFKTFRKRKPIKYD